MAERKSNENQSTAADHYRFGKYELHLRDRVLRRAGEPVVLAPKTFDALVCFVKRAGDLVTKAELFAALWPSTYVSDASLTNVIVALRKELGRRAIRTVSKHGYRFEMPVSGEPGFSSGLYTRFVRAKELTAQRSLGCVQEACELYCTCLAENPGFAPAWAWFGRSVYLMSKIMGRTQVRLELAAASFQRALEIDPDLACAHQFYTSFEADTGDARHALRRLLNRVARRPAEPESFAGLTQVFRYCGLLKESIVAGYRAQELDPAVVTSLAHSLFLDGDYTAAIEAYAGHGGAYLDAASWAALGETRRATKLLRTRLDAGAFAGTLAVLIRSLLAVIEGRTEEALKIMGSEGNEWDPESLVYLARHYARIGSADRALTALRQAAAAGFICAPETLSCDTWLKSLRSHGEYSSLIRLVDSEIAAARTLLEGAWPLCASATAARTRQSAGHWHASPSRAVS